MKKAKREMKTYYKAVLFRNWFKTARKNSGEDKKKILLFYRTRRITEFFKILKQNMKRNQRIKERLAQFFSLYFFKLKKSSFRTLKLETKYQQTYDWNKFF